jgi:thiol-disulfide isomerase/thioredoxin
MARFCIALPLALTAGLLSACHPTPATNSVAGPAHPVSHGSNPPSLAQLRAAPLLIPSAVEPARQPTLTFAVMFASWCGHCHVQLDILNRLRLAHPTVNFIGLSYAPFEEFNANGDLARLRDYVAANAPWLAIYTLPESLYQRVGRPSKVPTLWAFRADGTLLATFDRAERKAPEFSELETLVAAAQPAIQ